MSRFLVSRSQPHRYGIAGNADDALLLSARTLAANDGSLPLGRAAIRYLSMFRA